SAQALRKIFLLRQSGVVRSAASDGIVLLVYVDAHAAPAAVRGIEAHVPESQTGFGEIVQDVIAVVKLILSERNFNLDPRSFVLIVADLGEPLRTLALILHRTQRNDEVRQVKDRRSPQPQDRLVDNDFVAGNDVDRL